MILLPRSSLPLNVFEPRYLALVDDVLAGDRLMGLVQPAGKGAGAGPGAGAGGGGGTHPGTAAGSGTAAPSGTHVRTPEGPSHEEDEPESPPGKSAPLQRIGTLARLTAFSETDDGRYVISLTGIARFRLGEEIATPKPYRLFEASYPFEHDLVPQFGEEQVDRTRLLSVLRAYLDVNELEADWQAIHESSTEFLVNTLSVISPYGSEEKQALLEAPSLKERAEVLVALAEMDIASRDDGTGSAMQ